MKLIDPASRIPADIHLLIAQLMEIDPGHELIRDIRFALEIGDRRAGTPLCLDDYADGKYHRANHLAEYSEIQRRRWPPTGDRDLWVRYGPDGPPTRNDLKERRAA